LLYLWKVVFLSRYVNYIKRHWFLGLFVLIFLLGTGLRMHNYWLFPVGGETADETAWTMLGSSLLQTGQPTSWSSFPSYTNAELVVWAGNEFRLVSPALDHPPLFGLVPGSVVTLMGQFWKQLPSIKLIRAPLILIGSINLFLFAYWMWRLSVSKVWKTVSFLLFATAPAWVFLSRLVVSENLLTTWLLLLAVVLQSKSKWRLQAIVILHALLPLTKAIGIPLAIASVLILFTEKEWNQFWKPALVGLLAGLGGWLFYAAIFDFDLWWQVQFLQTRRGTGLANLYNSFLWRPVLINKIFLDPWTWLGHIVAGLWLVRDDDKKTSRWQRWWGLSWLSYWGFLLISVGENVTHGWYQIAMLPMLAIGFGAAIDWIWSRISWWGLALISLLLTLPVRTGLYYWLGKQLFIWQAGLQRMWLVGVGIIVLFGVMKLKNRQIFKLAGLLLIGLVVIGNILTVTQIDQWKYWEEEVAFKEHLIPPY